MIRGEFGQPRRELTMATSDFRPDFKFECPKCGSNDVGIKVAQSIGRPGSLESAHFQSLLRFSCNKCGYSKGNLFVEPMRTVRKGGEAEEIVDDIPEDDGNDAS